MSPSRTFELTEAELSLLAQLRGEQLLQKDHKIPLLDLALRHFGAEGEAREVLQRLLVHGLVQLDEAAADVRHHCFGVVPDSVGVKPLTSFRRSLPASHQDPGGR